MKLHDIEDADQLLTKDYLDARFQALEARLEARLEKLKNDLLEQIIASERAQRGWIFGAYGMIVGTYALIVATLYVNHFWR